MTQPVFEVIFRRGTIAMRCTCMFILSALVFSMSATGEPLHAQEDREMLAYVSEANELILYDPRDRTETTLLENVGDFVLSQTGRVAFTTTDMNDNSLYVFDPASPDVDPIAIRSNPIAGHIPLAWSPDGQHLALVSFLEVSNASADAWVYQGGYLTGASDQSLYVWDGETITNVMPDQPLAPAVRFFVDWSTDGRLAFTVQHGWSEGDIPPEIYLWDGEVTVNLLENPDGWDSSPAWSRNGQVLFGSVQDEEGGIYLWDGLSLNGTAPDVGAFVPVAPELNISAAGWTDDSLIALTVYTESPDGYTVEVMVWDPETQSIIQQIPVVSDNAWSRLSRDGTVILSSHLASGIPSVYLDVENIDGEILFSEHVGEFAWSSSGYLAYCGIEEGMSRLLSIWDGEESWVVARVSYRPVQWQYGRDTFSCNNG